MMLKGHCFYQDYLKISFIHRLNSRKKNQADRIIYIIMHTLIHSYPTQSIIVYFHFVKEREQKEQKSIIPKILLYSDKLHKAPYFQLLKLSLQKFAMQN